MPAIPPAVPLIPTAVPTSCGATVSPIRVMKFAIQMPWANIRTDISAMARPVVPAMAASQEEGVRRAAASIAASRARRGAQPRDTSMSETRPAATFVTPSTKKGIQKREPISVSDRPRSRDRYCGIQNM
jgi:hypothetical protein